MARPERFELPTFWFVAEKAGALKPCRCRTYRPHRLQNPASVGTQVGTREAALPLGRRKVNPWLRLDLVLRQNSVSAPSTGIHPCNNPTQPVGILLILKSAGILARVRGTLRNHGRNYNSPATESEYGPQGSGAPPSTDSSEPLLFTALQEQLGLKLESRKAPVQIIVIDHVERPSEN